MVCPNERDSDQIEPSGDLDSAQGEGEGEKLTGPSAFDRPRPKAAGSIGNRPPNLRRQSQALILNVHDTGEHAAAKRSDGKKGEWWDNALSRPSVALDRLSKFGRSKQ